MQQINTGGRVQIYFFRDQQGLEVDFIVPRSAEDLLLIEAASRILVRIRKQVAAPARLAPGLVLHEPDGRLTEAAEGILREGRGLEL